MMFSIAIQSGTPSPMRLDEAKRAIAAENFRAFDDACRASVRFQFGEVQIEKKGVAVSSLSLSMVQWLVGITGKSSSGRIYCNNEPCFFFRQIHGEVFFSRYNPEDISDPRYQNELAKAKTTDVIQAIAHAIAAMSTILKVYFGEERVQPDDQAWGIIGTLIDDPFGRLPYAAALEGNTADLGP